MIKRNDLLIGRTFICKKNLRQFYIIGRTYHCFRTGTVRDETGFDYDVLHPDNYFREPQFILERNNKN